MDWPFQHCLNLGGIGHHTLLRDDVTQTAQLSLSKDTLTEFDLPLIPSQQFQDQLYMLNMLLKVVAIYENIVK